MGPVFPSDAAKRRGGVLSRRTLPLVVLSICGAFVAACAAAPAEPATASSIGATARENGYAVAPSQTGELRFVVVPPEALVGGMAEVRR
jgi:hypothetical protein